MQTSSLRRNNARIVHESANPNHRLRLYYLGPNLGEKRKRKNKNTSQLRALAYRVKESSTMGSKIPVHPQYQPMGCRCKRSELHHGASLQLIKRDHNTVMRTSSIHWNNTTVPRPFHQGLKLWVSCVQWVSCTQHWVSCKCCWVSC